jgi:hypothetical protein
VPWLTCLVAGISPRRHGGSRVSPCGICGWQIDTGTGFSLSTSVFPCQFNSTGASLHEKIKTLVIFITGLYNKPQGCGGSVASAVGLFTKINRCIGQLNENIG